MLQSIKNIYNLGIKELRGLSVDVLMIVLIIYSFTLSVYTSATGSSDTLSKVPIAFVDEDNTQLSQHIISAFMPPQFMPPEHITHAEIDEALDSGRITFAVVIPVNFEKDVMANKCPEIQVSVDATRMSQAFSGTGYVQQIITDEITKFVTPDAKDTSQVKVVKRCRFNENLESSWFDGIDQVINMVTMLAILLTGSALIRERERGTLEHLLVMPVTPFEIMMSKVWSMGLVVLLSAGFSILVVIKGWLNVPITGSFWLFMAGTALHLFAVTSMGIFLACVAENMPQLGILFLLVLMPMQMLSGGSTPVESMPDFIQYFMKAAPTTHFVALSQAILFRGAGFEVVWKSFAWLLGIGGVFFIYSLNKFRKSAT